MARIGEVWDSTVDAARGRAAIVAPIAALAFLLPAVLQNGVASFADADAPTTGGLTLIVGLVTIVLAIWGQLSIIAIATDPATTRSEASAAARRRFPAVLGVGILVGLIVVAVSLPILGGLLASGIDFAALARAAETGQPVAMASAPSGGAMLFVFLYGLFFVGFIFWFGARVVLYIAVVLNERRGAGAITRSMQLTRGLTWKLIGVFILYLVVLLVAMGAVQAVVFLPLRLILGEGQLAVATFISAAAAAVVSAVLVSLFSIFLARLYVATAGVPSLVKGAAPPV